MDEFSEYSDADSMFQYCKDVQQVQKRLTDIQDLVATVNKEEELFGAEISTFSDIEQIQLRVEPYQKLFTITLKWQRSEKKWMDGGFLDLEAEQVEAEVRFAQDCRNQYNYACRHMNNHLSVCL